MLAKITIAGTFVFFAVLYLLRSMKRKKLNIQGKVVLITGATSGLGKACAEIFYKAGCRVILAGRNSEKLEEVKNELVGLKEGCSDYTPAILQIDLSNLASIPKKVAEAVSFYDRVDILINNAGQSYRGQVLETILDVDQRLMTVNYFGHVAITKALLPVMISEGGGHIIGISSIQGKIAIPYRTAYAASKHAFQAFFDSLRAEVCDKNITVSVLSPSYIRTNISINAVRADGSQHNVLDNTIAKGMKAEYVAQRILDMVLWKEHDVLLGPLHHRIACYLRPIFPNIFFYIMAKRALKERHEFDKEK
ncbi:dehydrogenase/reductase SDR family protein 7-like [Octopus bimaculoides]|uniref:Ketoreductase domain-containing protein n=1 Tax=Octopus bimaculoides TaxID=37653 RepID=A0A0L8FG92_OCTBM|nr:dehydrogenase/reductase SDR family protein 7-like [Octopus bimaculoides]|eukprot:XP_014790260.1 PREDICTED: dehydrogenase/reductase SDR family protein 7-like [Octopus bimaculoides]